jgi:hypothetical protein
MITKKLIENFVNVWNKNRADYPLYGEYSINSGWCYQFAVILHKLNPRSKIMSCDCHCWIVVGGKHYDSEHPRGSIHGLCIRKSCEVKRVSLRQLQEKCKSWGNSGPIDWKVVKSVVKLHQ